MSSDSWRWLHSTRCTSWACTSRACTSRACTSWACTSWACMSPACTSWACTSWACTVPHRRVFYGRVYVSKSKKALGKPSGPLSYKRWLICRDLSCKIRVFMLRDKRSLSAAAVVVPIALRSRSSRTHCYTISIGCLIVPVLCQAFFNAHGLSRKFCIFHCPVTSQIRLSRRTKAYRTD